ncbi:hypothetical protein D0Y65_016423 [Glycine soja]|uniref:Uncharacterized protein n=1 Tax=Glycine soja TaxID=3848 RepID=A0A445KGZ0_GLYSO|nr:hypothetical protein D0Y65_016423 [Glycine soja]
MKTRSCAQSTSTTPPTGISSLTRSIPLVFLSTHVVTGEIPKRFLYVGDMRHVVGESLKSFTSCYLMTMILHTLFRLKPLTKGLVVIGLEAMESEKEN